VSLARTKRGILGQQASLCRAHAIPRTFAWKFSDFRCPDFLVDFDFTIRGGSYARARGHARVANSAFLGSSTCTEGDSFAVPRLRIGLVSDGAQPQGIDPKIGWAFIRARK